MDAFIYLWRDKTRNMYYLGSHVGHEDDGYVSSSKWFNGEFHFRPGDFRRRIICRADAAMIRKIEYRLIKLMKDTEFGTRYYNIKSGREKGCTPWNTGKHLPQEMRLKISKSKQGTKTWNKGMPNPAAAANGRKSAQKVSATVTGRRMANVNGVRRWVYPEGDRWFWKENGEKCYLLPT